MTYAVSERANKESAIQISQNHKTTTLHHKKHHQCVFTYSNYSLFAAHRI